MQGKGRAHSARLLACLFVTFSVLLSSGNAYAAIYADHTMEEDMKEVRFSDLPTNLTFNGTITVEGDPMDAYTTVNFSYSVCDSWGSSSISAHIEPSYIELTLPTQGSVSGDYVIHVEILENAMPSHEMPENATMWYAGSTFTISGTWTTPTGRMGTIPCTEHMLSITILMEGNNTEDESGQSTQQEEDGFPWLYLAVGGIISTGAVGAAAYVMKKRE
ncbi:MAG: hypothetical protein KAT70_09835 [Thermoplasmata archaeon]|nr:hypothetical protein [Thermoplasmata archaeon]